MKCSLVRTSQSIAKMDHEKLGALCGLGFIKLRHAREFEEFSFCLRGFQGADIYFSNYNGKKMYTYNITKGRANEDVALPKGLLFEPDEDTNELLALVPDTEFNRNVLAGLVGSDLEPEILNAGIKKQVKEKAKAIQKDVKVKKSQEKIIVEQNEELTTMRDENELLRRQLQEMKENQNILQAAATEVVKENVGALEARIRKEIKVDVYDEMADLILDLKSKHGTKWAQVSEYKTQVLKVIDDRVAKRLVEEGVATNVDSGANS